MCLDGLDTAARKVAIAEIITADACPSRKESVAPNPVAPTTRVSPFVRVYQDWDSLAAQVPAWETLVRSAVEPNVFYEPWMLEPAIRALGGGIDFRFALIFAPDPGAPLRSPRLVGFFPLIRTRHYRGIPLSTLSLWKHLHCFLCTPIIHEGFVAESWHVLFEWLAASGESVLELPMLHGSGPVFTGLLDQLAKRESEYWVFDSFARALMHRAEGSEEYLRRAMSGGHRKELRRLWRRLGEQGRLEALELDGSPGRDKWATSFLELEERGWKGTDGGAMALHPAQAQFFREITAAADQRGKLGCLSLSLDGRLIAMKCNFTSGDGAFAFKIAFDETHARFSPGVQLELENVRWFHAHPRLRWMDSCADPRHPMIGRLWSERRVIHSLLVSAGSRRGDWALGALPALRTLKRLLNRRRGGESLPTSSGGET